MTAPPSTRLPASTAPLHLIVAHAAPAGSDCRKALSGLALPQLARLLRRMALRPQPIGASASAGTHADAKSRESSQEIAGEPPRQGEHTLSLPHERAYALALGLPAIDGRIPWAAWAAGAAMSAQTASPGEGAASAAPSDATAAWAWFTPCHWAVGRDHIAMRPPEHLALTTDESRELLKAMLPYFAEDGLAVEAVESTTPLRWRARGEMLRDLACASLERVVGARVDDWLPRTPAARPLRRLQQEMQMLLYTHPVNDAREHAGQLTVNSFWVDGAGALPPAWQGRAAAGLRLDTRLRAPAQAHDAAAWATAWQALDAQALPPLLAALDAGQDVRLTLAGNRAAVTYESAPRGWLQGLAARWRAPTPAQALESL